MMISTPARRISLRRKRCAGSTGNSDSPVSKRVSPSIEDVEEAVHFGRTSSYHVKKLHEPITSKLPSTPKNDISSKEERTQSEGQDGHQHSPDTPFMSSQLCGTQECEVVWDCNSPGYSKDDLKRMPGGDSTDIGLGSSPVTFVAPAPHRMLFPRSRVRPQPTTSAKDTTAQLDELLNQLSTRGSNIAKSKADVQPLEVKQEIIPIVQLCASALREFESSPPTPPPVPAILNESSQPFEIGERGERIDTSADTSMVNAFEDSLWGEDLNVGVCDISGISLTSDSNSKQKKSITMEERTRMSATEPSKDMSNMSADVFDDDLFNESVIRSTQAVEEAMVESEIANVNSDILGVQSQRSKVTEVEVQEKNFVGKMNFDSGIQKTSSISEDEGVVLSQTAALECGSRARETKFEVHSGSDVSKGINKTKVFSRSDDTRNENVLHANLNEQQKSNRVQNINRKDINQNKVQAVFSEFSGGIKPSTKRIAGRTSPIVGKQRKSPVDMASSERRVRSSFLLTSVESVHGIGKTTLEGNSGLVEYNVDINEKNKYRYGSKTHEISKVSNNAETSAIGANSHIPGRADPVVTRNKISDSSGSRQGTKPLSEKCHTVQAKRHLFNSNNSTRSDRAQVTKGSFSRSHSTDDAQIRSEKHSSFRRVNSTASVEVSREFEEDDAFFESILSTLPEEENLHESLNVASIATANKISLKSGVSQRMNQPGHNQRLITNSEESVRSGSGSLSSNKAKKVGVESSGSKIENNSLQTFKQIQKPLQTVNKELWNAQSNTAIKGKGPCQGEKQLMGEAFHDFGACDILDDDLFEDDVLTLIEEVESQYGSQHSHGEMSNSQPSRSQQMKCTQDEIAKKKEAAQRLREEKQKRRHQSGQYRPVC